MRPSPELLLCASGSCRNSANLARLGAEPLRKVANTLGRNNLRSGHREDRRGERAQSSRLGKSYYCLPVSRLMRIARGASIGAVAENGGELATTGKADTVAPPLKSDSTVIGRGRLDVEGLDFVRLTHGRRPPSLGGHSARAIHRA